MIKIFIYYTVIETNLTTNYPQFCLWAAFLQFQFSEIMIVLSEKFVWAEHVQIGQVLEAIL